MQKQPSPDNQLIVVELGAEWPSLPAELPRSARRVLAQADAESPAAFSVRVAEQLNCLLARGAALGNAIIACNERSDEHAQGARGELARALAGALAHASGGNLQLSVSDRNEGRSRAVFSALQSELGREWQSAAVQISLRFGDELMAADVDAPKAGTGSRRARTKDSARRVA